MTDTMIAFRGLYARGILLHSTFYFSCGGSGGAGRVGKRPTAGSGPSIFSDWFCDYLMDEPAKGLL